MTSANDAERGELYVACMVEERKERTMEDSRTLRMIMVTALVLAVAALLTAPAQAAFPVEFDGGSAISTGPARPDDRATHGVGSVTQPVTRPDDRATRGVGSVQAPAVLTASPDSGFDAGTGFSIAGGILALVLAVAGTALYTRRRGEVALP